MDEGVRQRMKDVESVVLDLDESVRGAAFRMMQAYVLTGSSSPSVSMAADAAPPPEREEEDLDGFFSQREIKKPSEAVFAIAAYFYQRYGTEPFTPEDVKELADRVGLTVPDRPDMTLKTTRKGKPIFRGAGRGRLSPTVYGEAWLKEEFGVSKGVMTRLPEGEPGL